MRALFEKMLAGVEPFLALAPMLDITDLPFWRLMHQYGGADLYYTEYIRVHVSAKPRDSVLRAINENPTGRPVLVQLIGNDIAALVRAAKELQTLPIVGIDLNLGCPAPIVYRKGSGGGLLREPERVDRFLGELRQAVQIKLTVKTRLGFESPAELETLLPVFARHSLDLLAVHGRTVVQGYSGKVHYDWIARAVQSLRCPVLANGDIDSAAKAELVLRTTGARGLMIGRAAIRNPWIFRQIRQQQAGAPVFVPRGHDVLDYARTLHDAVRSPGISELKQLQEMKRCLSQFGSGVDASGRFLHAIQRVESSADFLQICNEFLNHDQPMLLEPTELAASLTLRTQNALAGEDGSQGSDRAKPSGGARNLKRGLLALF